MDLAPDAAPGPAAGPAAVASPGAAPRAPVATGPVPGLTVLLDRLDPGLPVPAYAHPDDAGADLVAAADVHLGPGERALVGTGVALALPSGFAGFVHPRSGLAARHGVTVVNAPGTVDAGYRGEIMVNLLNTDPVHAVHLARGERIAQLVVQRVERVRFVVVDGPDGLPASARGAGGHGSTGTGALASTGTGALASTGTGASASTGTGATDSTDRSRSDQTRAADSAAGDDSTERADRSVPAEETTW